MVVVQPHKAKAKAESSQGEQICRQNRPGRSSISYRRRSFIRSKGLYLAISSPIRLRWQPSEGDVVVIKISEVIKAKASLDLAREYLPGSCRVRARKSAIFAVGFVAPSGPPRCALSSSSSSSVMLSMKEIIGQEVICSVRPTCASTRERERVHPKGSYLVLRYLCA